LFSIIKADFLAELLGQEHGRLMSIPFLGAWAGAHAARTNKRIVYSPFMFGKCRIRWEMMTSAKEKAAFLAINRDLIPETRFLSRSLSLHSSSPYVSSTEPQRQAALQALLINFGGE
jgi:hypothetical protein